MAGGSDDGCVRALWSVCVGGERALLSLHLKLDFNFNEVVLPLVRLQVLLLRPARLPPLLPTLLPPPLLCKLAT